MMNKLLAIITVLALLNSCVGYVAMKHVPKTYEIRGEATKESLISTWGQPDKSEVINNKEHLTYNKELSFDGVLLGVILPIPIGVPSYNKITYILENGILRYQISDYPETISAFLCGVVTAGHLEFGCYAK